MQTNTRMLKHLSAILIKVLSEIRRTPLKVDIETKMFKHFPRFLFIEINRCLFKAFKEREFDAKGWVQNLKSLLDMLGYI